MSEHTFNIVQAEFFYAKVDADTMEEATGSMLARLERGLPLKSALRFFDEKGLVTKLVKDFAPIRKAHEDAVLKRSNINLAVASRKMDALRSQARSLALGCVSMVTKGSKQIAVELPDRSFRMAAPAELDALLIRARLARGLWLFVFEPNDLCADSNESVGSMM